MRAAIFTTTLAIGTTQLVLDANPRPPNTYPMLLWCYLDFAAAGAVTVTFRVAGSAAPEDNPLLVDESSTQHVLVPCRPVPLAPSRVPATVVVTCAVAGVARWAWADSEDNR